MRWLTNLFPTASQEAAGFMLMFYGGIAVAVLVVLAVIWLIIKYT